MMEKKDTESEYTMPTVKEYLYTLLFITKKIGDVVKEKIEESS